MSNTDLINLYSQEQQGGELPYFVGKQYGSGWLRTLARLAFPIISKFGTAASNTAKDILFKGQSILPTIKKHGMAALTSVMPGLFKKAGDKRQASTSTHKAINKRRRMSSNTIFK